MTVIPGPRRINIIYLKMNFTKIKELQVLNDMLSMMYQICGTERLKILIYYNNNYHVNNSMSKWIMLTNPCSW